MSLTKRKKVLLENYDSNKKNKYVIYDNGDNLEQEIKTSLEKLRKEYG